MFAALDKAKLNADPHRGYHMLFYLAQTGVVCMGPDDSYVLVDEWIKTSRELVRDAALGELALRYYRSHGPATVADLQRWGKLTVGDAKLGTQLAAPELAKHEDYYFDEATLAIEAADPGARTAGLRRADPRLRGPHVHAAGRVCRADRARWQRRVHLDRRRERRRRRHVGARPEAEADRDHDEAVRAVAGRRW